MGEVWLAEDSRLGRKVALKLIPAEFTEDSERLRRFDNIMVRDGYEVQGVAMSLAGLGEKETRCAVYLCRTS